MDDAQAPHPGFELSREAINRLPLGAFPGTVLLVDRPERVEAALALLQGERLLGFDTETRPSFRKGETHPVALIQLASERVACLFRLRRTGLPGPLRRLLADPGIHKVGLGVPDELKRLREEQELEAAGFIDLLPIARRLGVRPQSVRALAAHFLGIRVSKSSQVSNWERDRLSEKQLRYAATDAWICRQVYRELQTRGLL
jgi:ribonuclease D